jgi:proteasome accessory factor B
MKRAERLLDLLALLLNSRRPVPFSEIRDAFPEDYGDCSDEAAMRKFERDKADLTELGIPLEYQAGDELSEEGYWVRRERYGLPALKLAPEERAMLYLAGVAALHLEASPFHQDLSLALNKISWAAEARADASPDGVFPRTVGRSPSESNPRLQEHLAALRQAIVQRKSVTLSYHGFWRDEVTQRRVDPYGLVLRRGIWHLVAHCHLRREIRAFILDRIRGLSVNPLKPKTPDFEFPAGLRLSDHVAREPWEVRAHPPVRARIRFDEAVAQDALAEFGPRARPVAAEGDSRIVEIEVTSLEGLVPTLLWYRGRAAPLSPPELCQWVRDAWRKVGEEHP